MERRISRLLEGIEIGTVPNLRLPTSISSPSSTGTGDSGEGAASPATPTGGNAGNRKRGREEDDGSPAAPTSGQQGGGNPTWWHTNPGAIEGCKLPAGKKFKDFFDHNVEALKKNAADWPKAPHHRSGIDRFVCIRYQTEGRCRTKCLMAHIRPSTMKGELKSEVVRRCQSAYSNT